MTDYIMTDYMVNVAFTGTPDAALLQAETARVEELTAEGVVRALHLAADRSAGWLVVRAETPDAVGGVLASLPLSPHMAVRTITRLADRSRQG